MDAGRVRTTRPIAAAEAASQLRLRWARANTRHIKERAIRVEPSQSESSARE